MGQLPAPSLVTQTVASTNKKGSHVTAKVGGMDYLVLVDSGADRSVIPKTVWMAITKGGVGWLNIWEMCWLLMAGACVYQECGRQFVSSTR